MPSDLELRQDVLEERVNLLEDEKKQIIFTLQKLSGEIISIKKELKSKSLEEVSARLDKLEGKVELISEIREKVDESIRAVTEQIAELRTMVLDREKMMSKMELEFEKIKALFKEIDPSEWTKRLEKLDVKIEENSARIEKIESFNKTILKETQRARELVDKIKSFENLVEIARKVDEKIKAIEETKLYADRLAAKIETIFKNMNEQYTDFVKSKEKIERVDEIIKDLVPAVDKLEIELEKKADKKDLETFRKYGTPPEFGENIRRLEEQINKISELEYRIEGLREEVRKKLEDVNKKISSLFGEEAERKEELERRIKELEDEISRIEEKHSKGEISEEELRKLLMEKKEELLKAERELREIEEKGRKKFVTVSEFLVLKKELKEIEKMIGVERLRYIERELSKLETAKRIYEELLLEPMSYEELLGKEKSLEAELSLLEEELRQGIISEEKYKELSSQKKLMLFKIREILKREEEERKMKEFVNELREEFGYITQSVAWIRENIERLKRVEKEVGLLKSKIEGVNIEELKENYSKILEALDKQVRLLKELKEVESRLEVWNKRTSYHSKYLELLITLPYIYDPAILKVSLERIKSLILKMKSINEWTNEKETNLMRYLETIAKMHRIAGREKLDEILSSFSI